MLTSDITLYAGWTQNSVVNPTTYDVRYNANGGEGGRVVTGLAYGDKHTVLGLGETEISFGDNIFTGWNTKTDGGGNSYKPGDSLAITGNMTLYAQWETEITDNNKPPLAGTVGEHPAYIFGYPDGNVGPNDYLTRAEAAAIVYRLIEDIDKQNYTAPGFIDVNVSSWYFAAVAYSEEHGIIRGYPDGTFRPENPLTRADFLEIITSLGTFDTGAANTFSDVPDAHLAIEYINNAAAKGWINGFGDGTFRPDENILRAQAVSVVNRIFDRKIELDDIPHEAVGYADLTSRHWAYSDIIEASNEHLYERKENGYEIWIE